MTASGQLPVETNTTQARRREYDAILAQLTDAPSEDFLAHAARMATIGYTLEQCARAWAERSAAHAHPFDDPDWQIVFRGELCQAAGISYARARELGALDALDVPGVACNMTTRDAIAQWCEDQGITPKSIVLDADRRLAERAAALSRVLATA
ncbi:MAG: hypothetical protein J0J04_08100 [Microbacterium sp.]|uniref:hypothetical protein n=1 Tax=Microbacterium sp. TaxID=51671 RepID=UPI001AD46454|nr:hypothetical protein [Microbacterium sp.]MBN9214762.1 hypothetical protein [Microbacterium sp.]